MKTIEQLLAENAALKKRVKALRRQIYRQKKDFRHQEEAHGDYVSELLGNLRRRGAI